MQLAIPVYHFSNTANDRYLQHTEWICKILPNFFEPELTCCNEVAVFTMCKAFLALLLQTIAFSYISTVRKSDAAMLKCSGSQT